MSHKTGKIEIIGIFNNEIYFKYHQAKNRKNLGKIFKKTVDDRAGWIDDFKDRDLLTKRTSYFNTVIEQPVSDKLKEVLI